MATEADYTFTADWISEIEASEKWAKEYQDRCRRIVSRYRDERKSRDNQKNQDKKRYPILWANIQVLGPAVYARAPEAVVSRRYKDSDPIGRQASEVLERAINFSCSRYDFDDRMKLCRDDYLLLGRGQGWVRYVPHVQEGSPEAAGQEEEQDPEITEDAEDEGLEEEQQAYAEVMVDHLSFDDFGYTPCREWAEVWYMWRRAFMGRAQLKERFGKIGADIPLDWGPQSNEKMDEETKERVKKAAIYEVWDKRHGEVLWFSKSYKAGPLDRRDDWLGLDGFFPCPRPLMATTPQDKFLPVPDYVYYQDQAEELDDLTARIGRLIDAIKVSGFYAGEINEKLQNLFSSENNQIVPIDSMATFTDKGGFKGLIEWFPIEPVAQALKLAIETRQQVLEDIYQITGISDIVRGSTDPAETATAQGIKAQWGSIRVKERQQELARFARDIMRIKGEIIAKKFQPQTLAAMTDVQLPTDQQKQAAQIYQQQAQQASMMGHNGGPPMGGPPQPGQPQMPPAAPPPPPPPNLPSPEVLALPSWEDVDGLLKNDALRSFRVDIETDSTVQPDENEEKARRVEFVTAIGKLLSSALPVLQQYPPAAPMIGQAVMFLSRGFRVGREMEEIIEKTFSQLEQQPPQGQQQPQKGPSQEELALKQQELQLQQQQMQFDAQKDQAQIQIDQGHLQAEQARTQADVQLGTLDAHLDAARLAMEHHQHQQENNVALLRPQIPGKPR